MLDRDGILEAVELSALADELLGPRRGTSRSGTWSCPSATHAQTGRTPPVSVFRASDGEQRWYCHGCGVGGTAIDLVMATRGVPVRDALEELASRAGGSRRFEQHDPPRGRPRPRVGARPAAVSDPAGLSAYVEECADRLWRKEGRPVLRWLTDERGLPEEVLRNNQVGADLGRQRQARPDGMPAGGLAAVLPVHEEGRPVFAQLRSLNPLPGRPRYLNAASRLAPNPRAGLYEPPVPVGRCVIVTEGVVDALSANAAGFRAAAVLGAAVAGDPARCPVADRLAHLGAPVIIAFDADEAGQRGAENLRRALRERDVFVARVHVPPEAVDMNVWMVRCRDWPATFRRSVRTAVVTARPDRRLSR